MKPLSVAAVLAVIVSACSGGGNANSYAPRIQPQAVRVGTNTLLLSVEGDAAAGYAPGSGGADTFRQQFTVCPQNEDTAVYDTASDPHGRLYELAARPVDSSGDTDTCPSAFIDIWYTPVTITRDADFSIGITLSHKTHSMSIDTAGKIYAGDLHDVVIFPAFVPNVTRFDELPLGKIHTTLPAIAAIRLDRYNNVYVAGTNHVIEEFAAGSTGNATPIRTIAVPDGISKPGSIAIARTGEIFTLASASLGSDRTEVLVYPRVAGSAPIRKIAGANTGLVSSTSLAICADGTLYVGGDGTIRLFSAGSKGNVPATVVWRRKGGIPVRSLNW